MASSSRAGAGSSQKSATPGIHGSSCQSCRLCSTRLLPSWVGSGTATGTRSATCCSNRCSPRIRRLGSPGLGQPRSASGPRAVWIRTTLAWLKPGWGGNSGGPSGRHESPQGWRSCERMVVSGPSILGRIIRIERPVDTALWAAVQQGGTWEWCRIAVWSYRWERLPYPRSDRIVFCAEEDVTLEDEAT